MYLQRTLYGYTLKIQKHRTSVDGEARAKTTPLRATGFRELGNLLFIIKYARQY